MGCLEGEAEDFVCDYHLEMLSLSQDQQNPASIQFDDTSWQCHLPSLKPLGLNIMLNLCNASATQQLCRFSDHLSNLALQESNGTVLPVYVPWGLCELSRLIGKPLYGAGGQQRRFCAVCMSSRSRSLRLNLQRPNIFP